MLGDTYNYFKSVYVLYQNTAGTTPDGVKRLVTNRETRQHWE
jgi:hypothetical protein